MDCQVGIAYLLAFEHANELSISPLENIELDRYIVFPGDFFLFSNLELKDDIFE